MKIIFFLGLVLFADISFARRRVLLTAFEPFMGRTSNGSLEVASLMPAMSDESVEYVTCILPVEYDRAAARARECYELMDPKPDMVISTGEGACGIQVETRALNLDNAPNVSDNAGSIRVDQSINDRQSPYTLLTLPVEAMVCAVENPDHWERPRASTWAGYFVCNNTAFQLSRFYQERSTPYGFIHVPQSSCGKKPSGSAITLNTMIRAGIISLENQATPDGRLPCELSAFTVQPEAIAVLKQAVQATCEEDYLNTVQDLLDPLPTIRSGDVK